MNNAIEDLPVQVRFVWVDGKINALHLDGNSGPLWFIQPSNFAEGVFRISSASRLDENEQPVVAPGDALVEIVFDGMLVILRYLDHFTGNLLLQTRFAAETTDQINQWLSARLNELVIRRFD